MAGGKPRAPSRRTEMHEQNGFSDSHRVDMSSSPVRWLYAMEPARCCIRGLSGGGGVGGEVIGESSGGSSGAGGRARSGATPGGRGGGRAGGERSESAASSSSSIIFSARFSRASCRPDHSPLSCVFVRRFCCFSQLPPQRAQSTLPVSSPLIGSPLFHQRREALLAINNNLDLARGEMMIL